jgi:hypothetical protein
MVADPRRFHVEGTAGDFTSLASVVAWMMPPDEGSLGARACPLHTSRSWLVPRHLVPAHPPPVIRAATVVSNCVLT